jgi:hypothetical protein
VPPDEAGGDLPHQMAGATTASTSVEEPCHVGRQVIG